MGQKGSWRRAWQPTPVFLPGESHEQRSLAGCSPQVCKELDTNNHVCACTRMCVLHCFSCVQLFKSLWTVAHQTPQTMGFSRQEHWSRLPCPSPGDLPDPGIQPGSPALAGVFFTTHATSIVLGPPRSPTIQDCLSHLKIFYLVTSVKSLLHVQ